MAADPLEKVRPGDPPDKLFDADVFNVTMDVNKFVRNLMRGRTGAGPVQSDPLVPSVRVYVKNVSGADLPPWSVVTVTGVAAVDPAAEPAVVQDEPVLEVDAPGATTDLVLITTDLIEDDGIGTAVIDGVAVASVQMTSGADRFCNPQVGDTDTLASGTTGSVRILAPWSTGTQKRLVMLGGQAASGAGGGGACSTLGWVAGLKTTDCLKLTVLSASGDCGGIDTSQILYLQWDGASLWLSADDFTHDAGAGPAGFSVVDGRPKLTIDGVEGVLDCSGDGFLTFAFGGGSLCTGTPAACADYFRVKVECHCCPFDGYDGPGWYCVEDEGGECTVAVQILGDGDECEDLAYCSGPYATEAEAPCGLWTSPCCSRPVSKLLRFTFSNGTGSAATLDGVTFDNELAQVISAVYTWYNSFPALHAPSERFPLPGGAGFTTATLNDTQFRFKCHDDGGSFSWVLDASLSSDSATSNGGFTLSGTFVGITPPCDAAPMTIVFTGVPISAKEGLGGTGSYSTLWTETIDVTVEEVV